MNRPAPSGGRSRTQVLVVEDDFDVAESFRSALDSAGYEVIGPVATAEEAIQHIKRRTPDAAVLDIALSPGTSAPVARALRARGCPFVFITGYSTLEMLPDELRGHRVLLKPVDQETLGSAIRELIRDRR